MISFHMRVLSIVKTLILAEFVTFVLARHDIELLTTTFA